MAREFRRLLTLSICFFLAFSAQGQTLSAARSTDWTLAGLREDLPAFNDTVYIAHGVNGGDTVGGDNATALSNAISTTSNPLVVIFGPGTFNISSRTNVTRSNLIIKGQGAGITTLNITMPSSNSQSSFKSDGAVSSTPVNFAAGFSASKDDVLISLSSASTLSAGDYVQLIRDDNGVVFDPSYDEVVGQIIRIIAVNGNDITLASPLRRDYPSSANPRLVKVTPRKNLGFECFTLIRANEPSFVNSNEANIRFNLVVNSWIKGVESVNALGSHVEIERSANILISGCFFQDGFDFSGGKAYGVDVRSGSSEVRVENSNFRRLRHSMVVQIGANGNVFAYNYSYDTFRGIFLFPPEDIFIHGNYPYFNLFEANVVNWIKADNTFGRSGPGNTIFRNRVNSGNSIDITNGSTDSFNIIGNEASGQSLLGTDHQVQINSWQSPAPGRFLEASLAYASKPDFLPSVQYGVLGYPGVVDDNPAKDRVDAAGDFVQVTCGVLSDINSISSKTRFQDLLVEDGVSTTIGAGVSGQLRNMRVKAGGALDINAGATLSVNDSVYLESSLIGTKYAQVLGDMPAPVVYEMLIQNPGWQLISAPISGASLAQLEDQVILNFTGAAGGESVFTWDAAHAQWNSVADNTASFDQQAFFIYLDDLFVRPGRGVNGDGNLPVKLTLRGDDNTGNINAPSLAYGTGASVVSGTANADGWNLMPNPYPSSLSLDQVLGSSPAGFVVAASVWDPLSETYEERSTSAQNPGGSHAIAPGQAFFVRIDNTADPTNTFFDFSDAERSITESPVFYKQANDFAVLALSSTLGQQKVYAHFAAGNDRGAHRLDVDRLFSANARIAQLALVKPSAEDSLVRALAIGHYEEVQKDLEIPLLLTTPAAGDYGLSLDTLQLFDDLALFLEDKQKGVFYLLEPRQEAVNLELPAGSIRDRFALRFAPKVQYQADDFSHLRVHRDYLELIYPEALDQPADLYLRDLSGRLMLGRESFTASGPVRVALPDLPTGIYLLSLKESNRTKTTKLFIP